MGNNLRNINESLMMYLLSGQPEASNYLRFLCFCVCLPVFEITVWAERKGMLYSYFNRNEEKNLSNSDPNRILIPLVWLKFLIIEMLTPKILFYSTNTCLKAMFIYREKILSFLSYQLSTLNDSGQLSATM